MWRIAIKSYRALSEQYTYLGFQGFCLTPSELGEKAILLLRNGSKPRFPIVNHRQFIKRNLGFERCRKSRTEISPTKNRSQKKTFFFYLRILLRKCRVKFQRDPPHYVGIMKRKPLTTPPSEGVFKQLPSYEVRWLSIQCVWLPSIDGALLQEH